MDPTSLRQFAALAPPDALKIVLVLFLSFLLGLEREGRKAHAGHYIFGGVRTFPLIGLVGYTMALLAGGQILAVALGLVVVGAFLLVSYLHKLASAEDAGVTTEISASSPTCSARSSSTATTGWLRRSWCSRCSCSSSRPPSRG